MTEYIQRTVCNYNTLGQYQFGKLGAGSVAPYYAPVPKGLNIVPDFNGVSYQVPNYNSLVHGSCINHVGINQAYPDKDCVRYIDRSCPGPSGRLVPTEAPTGYTGARVSEPFTIPKGQGQPATAPPMATKSAQVQRAVATAAPTAAPNFQVQKGATMRPPQPQPTQKRV
jgi:hypothetical protein